MESTLGLHKIVKGLGMKDHDIHTVFELAKQNQLEHLQCKVEYLTKEIFMLELLKTEPTNDLLNLNKMKDGFQFAGRMVR